jgi:hypothetical protein
MSYKRDMIERAAEMNFKIEFSNELFVDPIIKKMYFLLKYKYLTVELLSESQCIKNI